MIPTGENVLWIHGYRVVPTESAIYGPHGKLLVRSAAMDVLLKLARHAEQVVDCESLLKSSGVGQITDVRDLEALIHELRECFDDQQEHPLFIQGSASKGYFLATSAVPVSQGSEYSDVPPSAWPHPHKSTGTPYVPPGSERPVGLLHDAGSHNSDDIAANWIESLKRRRVFRVLGSYAVGSWLVLQITDVLSGLFPVPDWTAVAVAVSLAIGFPIVAGLTWAFQLTPGGVVLDVDTEVSTSVSRARLVHFLDLVIIGVLLVVVGMLSFGKFFPTLPIDSKTKIAVLPFQNLSESDSGRYLSEGISDDIRSRLYEVPQFLIAARTSTNSLSDKGLDIKTLGERLTVSHVLDGSVRREGDRVRVAVQLVDVSTGFYRWSKTYNSRIDDILDMQSNISLFVASELEILLTKEIRKALAQKPTNNPVAYDLYLQARSYLNRPKSAENLDKAIILFRQAIDSDPQFAGGYAGLCQTFIARYFATNDAAFIAAAEGNCDQALQLDADLAEVHTALGELYISEGRIQEADSSFRSALALDPKSIEAYSGLAGVYSAQGDYDAAEKQYRSAIDLLPGNWNGYNLLARFLIKRGRYEEAAENYQQVIAFTPDNAHAYNNLGAMYFLLGNFDEAAASYSRSLELSPGRAAYSNTGTMHYYSGDYVRAAAMFKKAAEEAGNDYRLWGNLADAQRFLQGSSNQSRQTYETAIRLARRQQEVNSTDLTTLLNLAFYYANIGDIEAAKELLQEANDNRDQDPEHEYTKALVYALLGQSEESSRSQKLAISLGFPKTIIKVTPEFQNLALLKTQVSNEL